MKNKIIAQIFLIALFPLIFTACPKVSKIDIEKLNNASESIAVYSRQGSNIAYGLWESGVIDLETKNKIFDGFIHLDEGGVAFAKFANFAKSKMTSGDIPKPIIEEIKAMLRSNVVEKFLDVLDKLKLIKLSDSMRRTIIAIKTAVLIFADALDIGSSVKSQIEAKEKLLI